MDRYEWSGYYRRRKRFWRCAKSYFVAWLLVLGSGLVIAGIVWTVGLPPRFDLYLFLVPAAYLFFRHFQLMAVAIAFSFWRCPHCRRPFGLSFFVNWPFTTKCVHCGLRRPNDVTTEDSP